MYLNCLSLHGGSLDSNLSSYQVDLYLYVLSYDIPYSFTFPSNARINWIWNILVLSLHRPVSSNLAPYKFFINGIIEVHKSYGVQNMIKQRLELSQVLSPFFL